MRRHVSIRPCTCRVICAKPLTPRDLPLTGTLPKSLIVLRRLQLTASRIFSRTALQVIPTQAFLVVTDSVLTAQPAPAPMHATVATRADSLVVVAMVLTAAPEETPAGTAEPLATVVTQKRVARIPRAVAVQVDARDDSALAAQAAQGSTAGVAVKPHAVASAATVDCSAAMVESADLVLTLGQLAATVAPAVPVVRAAHWPEVAEQVAQVERAVSEKAELTAFHPYLPREADKAAPVALAVRVALRVEKAVKASVVARV
jgi:hypothetical protein